MPTSIFTEKNLKPDEDQLTKALAHSYTLLSELNEHIENTYGQTSREWKFYGKNYGWQLKTILKKRNLFFILPHEGRFSQVFIFGDKAVLEIENSDLPAAVKTAIKNTPKYMEGRGFILEVRASEDLKIAKKLLAIKIRN